MVKAGVPITAAYINLSWMADRVSAPSAPEIARIAMPGFALLSRPAAWLALALVAASARADVFLGQDADGVPIYTDRPQAGFTLFLGTADLPAESPARRQTRQDFLAGRQRHAPQIAQAAREHGLDPALLHAVVQVESGYDAAALSPKGAVGLMQLMPATAQRLGVADRRDPLANLRGGARYLHNLIGTFGDLPLALAAYNAGENAVRRHGLRIPPYAETVAYVRAVLRRYELLNGQR